MRRWQVTPLQRSLGPHAQAWQALNERAFANHPMLSHHFVDGLLRHFGTGNEYLCVLEQAGLPLAMCVLRRKNNFQWDSFRPAQAQIAPTMIPEQAMVASLQLSLPGLCVQLDLLCNDPEFGAVLANEDLSRLRLKHALTMNIALDGRFDDYWAARPKALQKNIRRREKRLLADGLTQRFSKVTEASEVPAAFERYVALEGAGWKGREGTAVGSVPAQYAFYRELTLAAAAEGNAAICELWLGDQLAASRLILRRAAMQVMLKTAYDERFTPYAAGRLLLRAVIENGFAEQTGGAFEFYTDADANQLEWSTGQRWIEHRTYFRTAFVEGPMRLMRAFMARPQSFLGAGSHNKNNSLAVDVYERPEAMHPDARSFLNKAEKRNIGFGFAWFQNLVDTVYAHDGEVRFYVLRKGEDVIAVLPVRVETTSQGCHLRSLSNFYTSLYEPVLEPSLKSYELATVLAAIERDYPGVASFTLAPMDPFSHAYQTLIGAMRMTGWLSFEYFAFGNWYQPITENWADYLAARSSKTRSTIKRMGKKFAAEGGVLELVRDQKEMPSGLAAWQKVYGASWKRPEPFANFIPGLLQTYAEKGFLRLGIAWLRGQPIAAQLWIVSNGRAEIYKLAHNEDFKAYSPGTLLTAMLLEHVIDVEKVTEVDYLVGDDPYKKLWMSHRRERWGLVAYNPRSLRGSAGLAREAVARALKPFKKSALV